MHRPEEKLSVKKSAIKKTSTGSRSSAVSRTTIQVGSDTPGIAVKRSLNICHIADVHLGYRRYNRLTEQGLNQREVDVSQAFSEAVTRIVDLKPDITLVVGDLFHSVRPSNAIVTFGFREIKRLAQLTKAPVIIIAGNHETPRRSDTGNVLRLLTEIPNVFVADQDIERFSFTDLGLSVLCLPHAHLTKLQRGSVRADDRFGTNILALHAQLDRNVISEFGGVELAMSALSPNEWDYIALGHLHMFKEMSYNAAYCGSTEHTATNLWSEADRKKGFLQVTLPEGKKVFHSLTTPREVLRLPDLEALGQSGQEVSDAINASLENVAGGVDGKIIRITVTNLSREVFRQLDHKMIRRWRGRCLNFSLDVRSPIATSNVRPVLQRGGRLDLELKDYCQNYALRFATSEEVEKLLFTYIKKLEELNEASTASSEALSAAS